jgi:hypothetical protein
MDRASTVRQGTEKSRIRTRWHQLIGLLATTLTCVFGVGVVEELDLREESRERANHHVSASEPLVGPKSLGAGSPAGQLEAQNLAAVSCAIGIERLAEPGPTAARRISPPPVHVGSLHGPPVYRIAPSHSPPVV